MGGMEDIFYNKPIVIFEGVLARFLQKILTLGITKNLSRIFLSSFSNSFNI